MYFYTYSPYWTEKYNHEPPDFKFISLTDLRLAYGRQSWFVSQKSSLVWLK